MKDIVIINNKKYIFTGNIESKKERIFLAYNLETRQTEYFVNKKNLLGRMQYVKVNAKLISILDNIFNLVEDDLLYSGISEGKEIKDASNNSDIKHESITSELDEKEIKDSLISKVKSHTNQLKESILGSSKTNNAKASKTLEDFDVEKYDYKDIDDERYNEVFKECLKKALKSVKEYFPECNSSNLDMRIPSLKLEIVDDDKSFASFSRWKNVIYISRKTFKNPKLLNNVICHEIFHLIGTETEITKGGLIKKGTSRRTGFESRFSYGKGINEGFVQKYANTISTYINLLTFEVRIADLLEIIFADDLAKDNSFSDISTFNTLSKDRNSLIHFVKLVDNYHMLKSRYIDNESIQSKYLVKYNFISDIEKCLIEFFFGRVKEAIKDGLYTTKEEVISHTKMFKEKLIFMQNVTGELGINTNELIDEFEEVKILFVVKVKELEKEIEKYIIKQKHEKEFKLIYEIKKITKFTFNITDVLEILDDSFRKSFKLSEKERVYLLAQKMDNKRKFYIVIKDDKNNVREILNQDVEIMKELKDAIVYNNLNISDEAREKERRHTEDRTFSIYRKIDGVFGIADLVDKQNKILRALKTLKISIPFFLIDDSLEDFSYLNDFVKPDLNL